jgi:preprotein translocase subunit Sss1
MATKPAFTQAGWFIGLWLAGVLAVGLVGLVIKLLLGS